MQRSMKPVIALIVALPLTGCADSNPDATPTSPVSQGDDHAAHSHPTEGPHHGALIELGAEEYHGELVHDEQSGTVTIWILDSAAKTQVPIEAPEISINVKHGGQGERFQLAASAETTDPAGRSSRFVSSDPELGHHLHEADAEPVLVLTIAGKSFRGVISADHGHDHNHAHGDTPVGGHSAVGYDDH